MANEKNEETTKPETNAAESTGDESAAKEQPRYMTPEDFNKASTAREKRLVRDIEGMFQKFAENMKPTAPAEASEEGDELAEEKPAVKAKPSLAEIAAKKALAKAQELEKRASAREEEARKEKEKILEKEEKSVTIATLTEAGVTSAKAALAVLKQDGKIGRNKEGDLVFLASREAAGEKYEEELPLNTGIKEWLDSEDGKLFQPPRRAEGSGASANPRADGTRRSYKDLSKAERRAQAGKTLMDWALRKS